MRAQETRHALGSEVALTLRGAAGELPGWFAMLWQEISLFEHSFSRFLLDSELTKVNASAGLPVPTTQEFLQLLRCAMQLSARTDGLFNPLVLPDLQRAGYKGSWPQPDVFNPVLDYSQRALHAADEILIADETVQLPAGAALDFGGIGKGYLLDQLADMLVREGCTDFWLSLGGDIAAQGSDEGDEPWRVGIAHAETGAEVAAAQTGPGERLAVATSGITKRKGAGWHHIIDPRTGKPAETDVLTATVCGASGAEADVYAKCLVLLGSKSASAFMRSYHITRAVLQHRGKGGTIVVQREGL